MRKEKLSVQSTLLTLGLLLSLRASLSFGQEPLSVGFEASAGSSQALLRSRYGAAALYNPANLSLSSPLRSELQLSLLSFQYQYIPLDIDLPIATLKAKPLAANVSLSGRVLKDLYMGLVLLPLGAGAKTEIDSVPLQIGSQVSIFDVSQSSKAYRVALAFAYRFSRDWRLGVSALYDYADDELTASQNGQERLQASYKSRFISPLVALRSRWLRGRLLIAASYSPEQRRLSPGRVRLSLGGLSEEKSFAKEDSKARSLKFGLRYRFTKRWDLTLDGSLQHYAAHRRGFNFNDDDPDYDFRDPIAFGMSSSYYISPGFSLLAGLNYQESNLGTGQIETNPLNGQQTVLRSGGGVFGDLESLESWRAAFGGKWRLQSWQWGGAYSYRKGDRFVEENAQSPGTYRLRLHTVTAFVNLRL